MAEFANAENRLPAFLTLSSRGEEALPAAPEGLKHASWNVRRWCALFIDNFADAESLRALVPLLRDPKADVRLWAVHSLSCETCKDGPNPIEPIPHLLERIEVDESIRVRRQAVAMLAHHRTPDAQRRPNAIVLANGGTRSLLKNHSGSRAWVLRRPDEERGGRRCKSIVDDE